MQIEIDQSGKIEYTRVDTVIAYSNHKSKSILIKAQEKRKLELLFKRKRKPRAYIYQVFAVLIYLLIKNDLQDMQSIIIDQEYQGKESDIKAFLFRLLKHESRRISAKHIHFVQIGKKSKAHLKAFDTYKKHIQPDIVVMASNIKNYVKIK